MGKFAGGAPGFGSGGAGGAGGPGGQTPPRKILQALQFSLPLGVPVLWNMKIEEEEWKMKN